MAVPAVSDGDIAKHRLATIAVTRRLDGTDGDDATHLVNDERREGFAFDVFGNDQQRLARFGDGFENSGTRRLGTRNLLLEDQDLAALSSSTASMVVCRW